MKKEVQKLNKTTRKYNLYFTIFSLLKEGLNPSQICKKLNLKKSNVNYYVSSLKQRNLVKKIGYGTYEVADKYVQTSTKKTSRVGTNLDELKQDQVRGHAFQFVLKLPSRFKNWKRREEIFRKIGFDFKPLILGGLNRGQKIVLNDRKIWLTERSIIIYEKASYFGETASDSKDQAISGLLKLIRALERKLQTNFSFAGKYKFKVSRQHYALVKNALARQYNDEGKKLNIYTDKGLWFLIDNSFNLHEAETVHPKTGVDDNDKVKRHINNIKETPIEILEEFTPKVIMNSIGQNSKNLGLLMKEQVVYAQNIKTHVSSIQKLGSTVETLYSGIRELMETIKDMKEIKK